MTQKCKSDNNCFRTEIWPITYKFYKCLKSHLHRRISVYKLDKEKWHSGAYFMKLVHLSRYIWKWKYDLFHLSNFWIPQLFHRIDRFFYQKKFMLNFLNIWNSLEIILRDLKNTGDGCFLSVFVEMKDGLLHILQKF